ncbi:MAG: YggS family pyridoxal phosphate-dependent enzyme [Saccharospirillaceae bacterium]|nr:YggS family pyridoxal phosphate-dependent enzyme [Pseudomonadales bacterium]NRB78954.1 YggS family pyridoxal phosphate-dependent enzyme [Saccharospirillaceae bacterium]
MHTINNRIKKINITIENHAKNRLNHSHTVQLLAVSKRFDSEHIINAYHCGLTDFGENYVQEAVAKIQQLQHLPLTWHFIGPIQSNKTQLIAQNFDWVQTVSREKIIARLQAQRPDNLPPLNTLIQVNISQDPNKSGVLADFINDNRIVNQQPLYQAIYKMAQLIQNQSHLTFRGLMTISEKDLSDVELSLQYSQLDQIYQQLKQDFKDVDTLSMGMSQDVKIAIQNGSTQVRIGTAIFGQRDS